MLSPLGMGSLVARLSRASPERKNYWRRDRRQCKTQSRYRDCTLHFGVEVNVGPRGAIVDQLAQKAHLGRGLPKFEYLSNRNEVRRGENELAEREPHLFSPFFGQGMRRDLAFGLLTCHLHKKFNNIEPVFVAFTKKADY